MERNGLRRARSPPIQNHTAYTANDSVDPKGLTACFTSSEYAWHRVKGGGAERSGPLTQCDKM